MTDTEQAIGTASFSRKELRELVRSQLQALLEQNNYQGAKVLLVPVQPADIAEAIEGLPDTMQALAFRLLSKSEAIEVYENLDSSIQQTLIEDFKRQDVIDIVDKMSPDDRARLFDELPAKVVRQLLQQLSAQEREATALLLGYEAGTAGRAMTPEYIALKENWTVERALTHIRKLASASETVYYLYVTDHARQLTGILSLRILVTGQPEQTIGELMTREVVSVQTGLDQEEVARLIQRYDFLAVPVVDTEERLVGIITVDDVIDILEEEATKDIYALGGVQSGGDNYFQTNLLTVARKRVAWLLVLLVANIFTITVMKSREGLIQQVPVLATFIPLLIGTGGNVGAQSSTVVIRGLNTDELKLREAFQVIRREAIAGALLGLMLGLIVTGTLMLVIQVIDWPAMEMGVAVTIGCSLIAIAILASSAGAALPTLFQSLGFDPALMSAPFITTVVDVVGVFVYLTLARQILQLH